MHADRLQSDRARDRPRDAPSRRGGIQASDQDSHRETRRPRGARQGPAGVRDAHGSRDKATTAGKASRMTGLRRVQSLQCPRARHVRTGESRDKSWRPFASRYGPPSTIRRARPSTRRRLLANELKGSSVRSRPYCNLLVARGRARVQEARSLWRLCVPTRLCMHSPRSVMRIAEGRDSPPRTLVAANAATKYQG
jgi:hypothetical protein